MTKMANRELWRKVPSVPNAIASTHGRVMYIPKLVKFPSGWQKHYGGYPTFGTWAKGEKRFIWRINKINYRVSRLVCEAYHGKKPFPKAVVIHIDENSRNNKPENLKWGTQKENLNAPGFIRYCKNRTGENNPYIKGTKRFKNN